MKHIFYTDSKQFLVDAFLEGKMFLAWEDDLNRIVTVEVLPGNYPDTTVCIWKNKLHFVFGITWYDWIKSGVNDEEVRKLLESSEIDHDDLQAASDEYDKRKLLVMMKEDLLMLHSLKDMVMEEQRHWEECGKPKKHIYLILKDCYEWKYGHFKIKYNEIFEKLGSELDLQISEASASAR